MTETKAGPLADKTVTDLLVTAEAVIRDLDRWEFVYEAPDGKCSYRDERGAPDCLIGHVLYRWGALDEVEEGGADISLPFLGATDVVTEIADEIQVAQDLGTTWGGALEQGRLAAMGLEVAA